MLPSLKARINCGILFSIGQPVRQSGRAQFKQRLASLIASDVVMRLLISLHLVLFALKPVNGYFGWFYNQLLIYFSIGYSKSANNFTK